MGLDQYAYINDESGNREDFFYWRKHPAIQSWMENLWESKGRPDFDEESMGGSFGAFNCAPVQLLEEDLKRLKQDIENDNLEYASTGFFFGSSFSPGDEYYQKQKERDLDFVSKALEYISQEKEVYYTSWW